MVRIALVLIVGLAACGATSPCERADAVACVDGRAITAVAAREHLIAAMPELGRAVLPDPTARAVDAAIRVELFAAAARTRGLADGGGPPARRLATLHRALIADERTRLQLGPEHVDDATAAAFYARTPGRVSKVEAVTVRAIYADDAATAEALYTAAVGLDDAAFATLARERSRDPSAASGGDLGVVDDDHAPIELVRAVTALREPGALVGPTRLADGRFVIARATDVTVRIEPFDTVAPRVKQYLAREAEVRALDALAAQLEREHRVQRFQPRFAAVAAAPAPGGAP